MTRRRGPAPTCLRRAWLLARLAGHLDAARPRSRPCSTLRRRGADRGRRAAPRRTCGDEWAAFDADGYRGAAPRPSSRPLCRCDPPTRPRCGIWQRGPRSCTSPVGLARFLELAAATAVAIVGARRASPYGVGDRPLARPGTWPRRRDGGQRDGDRGRHRRPRGRAGRPAAPRSRCWRRRRSGPTRRQRGALHAADHRDRGGGVRARPGQPVRRWMFPARNRIIAALAAMTVVVGGAEGSGAMLTARRGRGARARRSARCPARSRAPLSLGTAHGCCAAAASWCATPEDVLDGARSRRRGVRATRRAARRTEPELAPLFDALADGYDLPARVQRRRASRRARAGRAGVTRARPATCAARREVATRSWPDDMPRLRPNRGDDGPSSCQAAATDRRGDARAGRIPCVLSIAGSDSGGGRRIQADLKAFAACGVHGMTAITAITAQNTVGVTAVQAISPEMIVAQVRAVADDIGVDAVKIGMLGTVATIEAVAAGAGAARRRDAGGARPGDGLGVRRRAARAVGARGADASCCCRASP